jgi:ABC-type phosphate transport system permease subunit
MNDQNVPGKGAAIGSLVCGIVSIVFWFFGITSILSLILGIVGLILSSSAKKAGYNEGLRTAGFVLSLLGTIFGALIFVSCIACAGCLGAAGGLSALSTY